MSWISITITLIASAGAIASAIVAYLTYRQSKRPDVVVYLDRKESSPAIWFVVENFGNGIAYDISINPGNLPSEPIELKRKFDNFVSFGIPMLVPHASRCTPILIPNEYSDEAMQRTYSVEICYKVKQHGKLIRNNFKLDYESFHNALYIDSNETLLRKAVEKIAKNMTE